VELTIQNEVGYSMIYQSHHFEHGKVKADESQTGPTIDGFPENIAPNNEAEFTVENDDASLKGVKGHVTYGIAQPPPPDQVSPIAEIYFDHPQGSGASSYSVSFSNGFEGSYRIEPSTPTGHNQKVTITIYGPPS
jgi:hypothetical protein